MFPPGSTVVSQSDNEARIDLPFTQGTLLTSKYINVSVAEGVNPCKNTVASGGAPATSENVTINGIAFLKEAEVRLKGNQDAEFLCRIAQA